MSFAMLPRELYKIIHRMTNSVLYAVWYQTDNMNDGELLVIVNDLDSAVNALLSYVESEKTKRNEFTGEWVYNKSSNGMRNTDLYIEEIISGRHLTPTRNVTRYVILNESDASKQKRLVKYKDVYVMTYAPYSELVRSSENVVDTSFIWKPTDEFLKFLW